MSNYSVAGFAQSNGLIVVGSLSMSDPKFQELRGPLMRASFSFPIAARTLAFFEMTKTTVGGLLYSEDADRVLNDGPGSFEPQGLVEFHFQTGEVKTFVFRDEPVMKAMFDGKRRSWREKHAQRR